MPNYIKLGNLRIEIPEPANNGGGGGGGGAGLLNGLLAFYNLSDLTDASGNGNTLTNTNGVTFSSGKIGNAATFGGSNGLTKSVASMLMPKTISAWAKLYSDGGFRGIVLPGNTTSWQFGFQLTPGNNLRAGAEGYSGSQYAIASSPMSNDIWYHLVMTNDSDLTKLYINGALNSQQESSFPQGTQEIALSIGSHWYGADGINGQVDAVGFWSRAITDAEISELYNAGAGKEHPFA
jgi:hypothetical protein